MSTLPGLSLAEESFPLTPMQSAMLFHNLLAPGSGIYLEQVTCDLNEPLNREILERSWNEVIQRHTSLRTRINLGDQGGAVQQVDRRAMAAILMENWSDLSPETQEARFLSFQEHDLRQDFDLLTIPMRWALFRLSPSRFRLLWTFHHALLDGRSTRIVLKELFAIYDSIVEGCEPRLRPTIPFRDYVDWLRKKDDTDSRRFWQEQLRGCSGVRLLVEHEASTSTVNQDGAAVVETQLSFEVSQGLRAFALEHDLTMNTLVQGAWAQLLCRYSDSEDVIFGATRALRHSSFDDAQDLVGVLINTVPVRVSVPPEMSLLQFLKNLRAQWIGMRPYEHASLAQILQWAEISQGSPLFSSLVVCENSLLDTAMQEFVANPARKFHSRSVTGFPLTVVAFAEPQWILKIGFKRSHFDVPTMRRMLGHLQELLEKTLDDLHRPLGSRSMLTEMERRTLLVTWQQTQKEPPAEECVHRLFEQQVDRTPKAVAVDCPGSNLSYDELNRRANQLAHYLRRLGVVEDSLVGFCLPRSSDLIIALLAIQKAGGAYVPLDATFPQPRLTAMIRQAELSTIVTVADLADRCADSEVRIVCLDSESEAIARLPASNPHANVRAENLAYGVFTSGSTGQPKGILISHRALANHTCALIQLYGISNLDRRLQLVSTSSDVLIAEIFPYLVTGGTIVVRSGLNAASVDVFLKHLDENRITIVGIPSALWHEWVLTFDRQDTPLPKSLRIVISGMDQVRPDLFEVWRKKVRGRIRWFNAYGPSETTCTTTVYEADLSSDEVLSNVPIGRPIANTQVYVLDRRRDPVPVGVPGEIYIGGHGLARGYLNCPDLTAERFIDDTIGRLYKSGDLGRFREDGNIEFLGRVDRQVKLRGYRIELGEIEAALNDTSDMAQSVVVLREDRPGDKHLVAYCVPIAKTVLDFAALRSHLRQRLPEYMVPSRFMQLPTLPLTPSGKVNRLELPCPDDARQETDARFVAPRTHVERQLAAKWSEVLGVAKVGIHDNFFDLGGTSLKAVSLLDRIVAASGRNLPLSILMECSTIAKLACALQERSWSPRWKSLVSIQAGGTRPPLFIVPPASGTVLRFAKLARHLGPECPVFGLEPPGHDGCESPLNRVEDMACLYVDEILALKPTGPILLAGVCFGGHVIWEMAKQLTDRGFDVALVALLDAIPPAWGPSWLPKPRRHYGQRLMDAWKSRKVLKSIKKRFVRELSPIRIFKRVARKLMRLRSWLHPSDDRHVRMLAAHRKAQASYTAKCFAGEVLLIQSEEFSQTPIVLKRWSELAVGRFKNIVIPGASHDDLLNQGKFTPILGQLLREHLDAAVTHAPLNAAS